MPMIVLKFCFVNPNSLIFALMIASAGAMFKVGRKPIEILLGLMALFYTLQYLTYTFGDLGFQIMRNQMMKSLKHQGPYLIEL